MDSNEIIQSLALRPHPEGGWYRELHPSSLRVKTPHTSRCALTSIYYLLQRQELSRWHTVDADEIWHFYSGAPLELFTYEPTTRAFVRRVLAARKANRPPPFRRELGRQPAHSATTRLSAAVSDPGSSSRILGSCPNWRITQAISRR